MLLNSERFVEVCARRGLDGLVATSKENVYYASEYLGFGQWILPGSQAYVVLGANSQSRPRVVCGVGDADMALESPLEADRYETFGTFYFEEGPGALQPELRPLVVLGRERQPHPSALAALAAALAAEGLGEGRIGVDERGLLPGMWEQIASLVPRADLVPAFDAWQEIRVLKTPEEIRRLTEAARATERAIRAALAVAREGITEAEMARAFEQSLIDDGTRPGFTVIGFGQHGASPNAQPSQRRLARGDLIRFDVGCLYQYYWSDISRTAVFGEPSEKQRRTYAAILAGEDCAMEALRPGATAEQVFSAAVEGTRAAGLPHYRRHHVGHGVGIFVYDPPILQPGNQTVMEPGMVFEVETPYYELGFGGVQVEDTMLVTPNGNERLTQSDRDLIVVE